jgi:hypothetical protein
MYPIFKFLNLAFRLFSRPSVEFMKRVHWRRVSPNSSFSHFLIRLGNAQYKFKVHMDKRLMNIRTDDDMFMRGLKASIALERGIHFFYESLFYTFVIGAALLEGYKIAVHNYETSRRNEAKLNRISADLDKLIDAAEELILEHQDRQMHLELKLDSTSSLIEDVLKRTESIIEREKKLHEFIDQARESQNHILNDLREIEMRKP